MANINTGITKQAVWNQEGLTATAADFVRIYGSSYLPNLAVTSSSNVIIFTATVPGDDFGVTITNVANFWQGSIRIQSNDIYEQDRNNDTDSFIWINRIGYQGGMNKQRHLAIGNGKGLCMMQFSGGNSDVGEININANKVLFNNIPTSSSGLPPGNIYSSGGYLRIV